MVSDCQEYNQRGYCIRGAECPYRHSTDLIELDISDYNGLIRAKRTASAKAAAIIREQQIELKRKQAELLTNLISQQRALIKKIELCADEGEKVRLKKALDEALQKTKDWVGLDEFNHDKGGSTAGVSASTPAIAKAITTTTATATTKTISSAHRRQK